jgi:hypothetical protein
MAKALAVGRAHLRDGRCELVDLNLDLLSIQVLARRHARQVEARGGTQCEQSRKQMRPHGAVRVREQTPRYRLELVDRAPEKLHFACPSEKASTSG